MFLLYKNFLWRVRGAKAQTLYPFWKRGKGTGAMPEIQGRAHHCMHGTLKFILNIYRKLETKTNTKTGLHQIIDTLSKRLLVCVILKNKTYSIYISSFIKIDWETAIWERKELRESPEQCVWPISGSYGSMHTVRKRKKVGQK